MTALDASARVNTRENVRLTFDQKVEDVIQEIVDSNFDLYKRITDDRAFGEAIKNFLFDQYLRAHRQRRGADQARRVEDARVQVDAAMEPYGGPEGRQRRHSRRSQDDRCVSEYRGWRSPDRGR